MSELSYPPAILDILETHLNELDFLWEQRERFVFSADWTLRELGALEERAEAHLDGLRVGAGHSVDLARPLLVAGEPGIATAATFVLMASEVPELEREVLEALKTAPPESRDGIRVALRHSDVTRISTDLAQTAVSAAPVVRAAALDILAFHRLPAARGFAPLLHDAEIGVRRLVCEAAGRFGGPWGPDFLSEALESSDPGMRLAALRTSARIGLPRLDVLCRNAGTRTQNPIPEALTFLGVVGNPRDVSLFQNCLRRPDLALAALNGLGKLGSISAVPILLDAMRDDKFAHAAGRAFIRITRANDIEAVASPPIQPPDEMTEDEIPMLDTSLRPDPVKARAWWDRAKGRFTIEGRWQSGYDISEAPLREYFNALPLDSRLDVYLGARAQDPQRTPDLELQQRVVTQVAYRSLKK